MTSLRIALAQFAPRLFEKAHNLSIAEQAIRQAAAQGAQVILFPELFLTGYSLGDRALEMAEALDGPSIRRVAEWAAQRQMAVIMGFAELSPDGRAAYDSAFVVDPWGRVRGAYRKIHLYHQEADWFLPGEAFCLLDFGFGPTGLLICYDLEFPEAARQLALMGAQWIAVCTGIMAPNQHLQDIYVQARAAENRLWVAVANRVGREGELVFFGRSALADPWGAQVAQAGEEETLLIADIDLTRAAQARLNADYLADRRPELYRRMVAP